GGGVADHLDLQSCPTRRSSDLGGLGLLGGVVGALGPGGRSRYAGGPDRLRRAVRGGDVGVRGGHGGGVADGGGAGLRVLARVGEDRKSTRLNSSHVKNSYAVFC